MSDLGTVADRVTLPSAGVLPKLGFVGTGWIGRLRMEALLAAKCAEFAAVHDPSVEAAETAARLAPGTHVHESLDALLADSLDGVVIASPSALHAEHCERALEAGKAVFCQKPLARTRAETERVLAAARRANRRLAVDFSYRYLAGMKEIAGLVSGGELGEVFSVDLAFHNAYGPDKPWFYDVAASGGGCVMDLGIHLVDLALWLLPGEAPREVQARLYRGGKLMAPPYTEVEDYASASFRLGEAEVRLSCSWNLHAGRDAVIQMDLYGTKGGASVRNVGGSFFDFEVCRFRGTKSERLGGYPDAWGGRALVDWARKLRTAPTYDPAVERVVKVAVLIDGMYGR